MQKGQVGKDLDRASGYLLFPKHRRHLSHGDRISMTDEDKPIGNSILRAGVLSRLHHVRSDQRRCRGNERHSLGVSRVATFIVAHRLSPSFGSAITRCSSPGGARAAAQQLIDQRTFARTRHQPSCQKQTWSSRPPKESNPVQIKTAWSASAAMHEKNFSSTVASSPNSSCDLSSLPAGVTAHCAIPTRASTTTPTTRPR